MKYHVTKPEKLKIDLRLPASKSISNRALVLNALSGGSFGLLQNLSDCDDTTVMLQGLFLLDEERRGRLATQTCPPINIGAAGTAMRFLTAVLAVSEGTHTLTGSERMQQRPIGVLVDALRTLGSKIKYKGQEGFPPLEITGTTLRGGELKLAGNVSSQYTSALLMIAPMLAEGLTLHLKGKIISKPYIDMTLSMMKEYGAKAGWANSRTIVVEAQPYVATPYLVESDWSAASYWYEAVLLSEDKNQTAVLKGLFEESLQGDSAVRTMFKELGVMTFCINIEEPQAVLCRKGRCPKAVEWDFTKTPDLAQTFVVACALKGIAFCFKGLQTLRIKETDRIAALVTELAKLGVRLEVEGDDIIRWAGPEKQAPGEIPYLQPLPGTAIDTYEDHRMAMAFAPAALVLGCIDINNPEVVSKSYKGFWEDWEGPLPTPPQGRGGRLAR